MYYLGENKMYLLAFVPYHPSDSFVPFFWECNIRYSTYLSLLMLVNKNITIKQY